MTWFIGREDDYLQLTKELCGQYTLSEQLQSVCCSGCRCLSPHQLSGASLRHCASTYVCGPADAKQCQQAGDFNDAIDALSGLVCGVFIVLTANIVTGIMPGFVCLVCGRVVAGEWRQVNPGIMLLTAALVPFYAGGWSIYPLQGSLGSVDL